MFSLLAKNSAAKAPEASLPSAQKRAKIISLLEPVILLVMACLALYALATRSMMPISAACVMLTFALLSPLIALYLILGGKVKLNPSTPSLPTLSAEGGESVQIPPQPRPLESGAVPPEQLEEIDALQTKLRAAEAATTDLQASQAALQQKIESGETKRRELDAELATLRSENETLRSEGKKDIAGLQATAKRERERLHEEITTLRQEAETANGKYKKDIMTLQTRQAATREKLEVERNEATAQATSSHAKVQLLRKELDAQKAEIAELRKDTSFSEKLRALEVHKTKLEEELKRLQELYNATQKKAVDLESQVRTMKESLEASPRQLKELHDLTTKLEAAKAEIATKSQNYEELSAEKNLLVSENERLMREKQQLKKQTASHNKEVEQLREQLLQLQETKKADVQIEVEKETQKLEELFLKTKANLTEKEKELSNSKKEITTLKLEINNLKTELSQLKSQIKVAKPPAYVDGPPPPHPDFEAQRKAKSDQLFNELMKHARETKSERSRDDDECFRLLCEYIENENILFDVKMRKFKDIVRDIDSFIRIMDAGVLVHQIACTNEELTAIINLRNAIIKGVGLNLWLNRTDDKDPKAITLFGIPYKE